MLDIRYTIGRKEGTSACTFSYPILPYAGHLVTVIGNIVAGLDKPLDSGWAKQVAIRHRAASVLSILSVIFAVIGIPLGLFLLGGETLYDPLYLLFFERSIGALLVWIGVISGLFSLYLRWHGEGEGLRVPSRPRGEELPELPLDIASYILKVLPITEPVAIEGILTERTRFVLAQAVLLAQSEGKLLRSVHIVQSIINSEEGQAFCRRAGISPSSIELRLAGLQSPKTPSPGRICDEQSYVLIHRAFLTAYSSRHAFVTPLELLLTCIEADEDIQEVFLDLALDPKDAGHIVAWVHFEEALRERMSIVGMLVFYKKTGHMNIAMTACPTPTLDKLTTELTALAQKGDTTPLLGRDDVLDQVFSTLSSNLGNVLLVGDPGCGKSELLRGIAQLMASEDVPQMLQDKRFLRLDPGSLIAGAEGVGGIEGRLKSVINETVRAGNVFLAIEDIHHLLGASSTGSSEDAGAMLMNALSEGALKLIATTTAQEFAQYIQPRPAFLRRFQIVHIQEMGREDTLRVLEAASLNMESRYGVTVSFAALTTTYDLCDQLMPDRHFPDKAIRILEQSCAYARSVRGSGTIVGKEHVAKVIEQRTTVVVTDPNASERKSLLSIEEHLRRRVVGQDDAVKTVASAMRRARTGMRKGSRPQAVLLFLGPTGVGKTETAKAIAALSFGGEDRMIRLDLSEYQTPESLEKLLGKSGVTSVFCDAVRRYPAHLLLLDEFEKAHPDVLNIFLQIFEDGRLTDGRGQTLNFAHAFVIATSNVGSSKVYKGLSEGKPIEEIRKEVIDIELPRAMRPELINRFDKVVFFRPLSIQNMIPIVQLQLAPLRQALDQRGVRFEIAETAVEEFARRGYDPTFCARGLRRLLQDTLEEEVSRILLEGDVHRRDTIVVSQGGVISVQRAAKLQ